MGMVLCSLLRRHISTLARYLLGPRCASRGSARTVIRIKQRFVQQGLQATLRGNYPEERPLRRKIDGRVEAHLIALACGPAPQGHRHWTMQLLADRVIDLGIVDQISDET